MVVEYKKGSKRVVMPDYISNKPVVCILDRAFADNEIKAVRLPKFLE